MDLFQVLSSIGLTDQVFKTADVIHEKSKTRLTEKSLEIEIKLLQRDSLTLQGNKVSVMALTARPPHNAPLFDRELANNGVDFAATAPGTENPEFSLPGLKKKVGYKGGVFYAYRQHKGQVLTAYLDSIKLAPKVIVFIDDSSKNNDAMQESLKARPVEAFIYDYTHEQARNATYNGVVARVQLKALLKSGTILSDDEALTLTATAPVSQEEAFELIYGTKTPAQK